MVLLIRLALLAFSYKRIAKRIRLRPSSSGTERSPQVIAWSVKHASSLVPKAHCLTRALAVQYLLARSGRTSVIRVGVTSEQAGRFEAHAWVVHEGRTLIGGVEEDISRFRPMIDLHPVAP